MTARKIVSRFCLLNGWFKILHKSCTNSAKDKIIIKILPQSCRQSFHHCTLFNWHDYINSRRCRCTQVIMRVHTSFYFQGWCLAQINSKYKNTVSISKNVTHLKILKSMFHKKILEKGVDPKKLHRTAPYFGACWPEIFGQSFAIFWVNRFYKYFLIKNGL